MMPGGRAYAPHLKLTDYATRCAICKRIFVSDAAFDAHGPDDYLDASPACPESPDISSADVSADFCPPDLSVRPCPRSRRELELARAKTARSMVVLRALGTKVTLITGPKEVGRAREIGGKAMSEKAIRIRDMREAKMDKDARAMGTKAMGAMGESSMGAKAADRPIARKRIRESWTSAEFPSPPAAQPRATRASRAARASNPPKKSADSTGAGCVLRIGSESYFPCNTCNRTFYSNLDRVRHNCPNRPKVECAGAVSEAIFSVPMGIGEAVKMRRRSGRR